MRLTLGQGGSWVQSAECISYRCRSRWCSSCSAVTRRRVEGVLAVRAAEAPSPCLVTLTAPLGSQRGVVGATQAYSSFATRWRRVGRLLRVDETAPDAARPMTRARREVEPPRLTTGAVVRSRPYRPADGAAERRPVASTWRQDAEPGYRWPRSPRDYACAIEIGGYDARRYHVHAHVLCSALDVAERLNAAWQSTRDGAHWDQTLIDPLPDGDARGRAARYVAKYSAKGVGFPQDTPDYWRWARPLPTVLAGRRLSNGSGAWRSLGLTRATSGDSEAADAQHVYAIAPGALCTATAWQTGGWQRGDVYRHDMPEAHWLDPDAWAGMVLDEPDAREPVGWLGVRREDAERWAAQRPTPVHREPLGESLLDTPKHNALG